VLVVACTLLALYIQAGVSVWSAWKASRSDSAKVLSLQAQNMRLKQEQSDLQKGWSLETKARQLGFAHSGEKTYAVHGLPPD
jgi:cell division protein FtsB